MSIDAADGHKRIIPAAIGVFAEKGRHGTRMEDVASRAGVTRSFLHRLYPRKGDLLREVLAAVADEALEGIGKASLPTC